mgnify:CR=1 FL=1
MTTRAQASNLGLVLLLALTITGAGVVVAFGSSALTDVQDRTSIDRAEHAMTLLDARAAVVGLGEGSVQTVRLGDSSGGDYAVESESGWLRIRHVNYTEGEPPEEIYNASLGSVTLTAYVSMEWLTSRVVIVWPSIVVENPSVIRSTSMSVIPFVG